MQTRQTTGFTIVELMVVVAIIGILAAMAIAGYIKIRTFSQDKTVLNNLRQIANAAQIYMLEQGSTTVNVSDLYPTYLREPQNVAGETYPAAITLNENQIAATGVGGTRTVVYSF